MENVADALKIAFAIILFVIALTTTFMLISQARQTADDVFYSLDETNFQEPFDLNHENEVSYAEVVSTLYRYYKVSICVTIDLNDGNPRVFDLKSSYANIKQIEDELAEFITGTLINYADKTFTEEFVEIPISGIYELGEDGTELVKSSGGKKVYVTYTLKN